MPRLTDSAEAFVSRLDSESLEDVAAELLYGVEIEFADAGELQNRREEDCPYDEDDAISRLEDNAAETLASHLRGGYSNTGYDIAMGILDNLSLEEAIDSCTRYSWSSLVSDELDMMADNWEPTELSEDDFGDVIGWEHCEDGTCGIVQEYKTDSPGILADITKRIHRLFCEAGESAIVPEDGSCHVHVSIPGCHHQASENSALHACILYELSQLVDEFPESLWDRIQSRTEERFFSLGGACQQKYTAVHCHSQGTWEFRLFGGLDDPDDCSTCVSIAGRAVLAAYTRFRDGNYRIPDINRFRSRFSTHIKNREKVPPNEIQTVVNPFDHIADGVSNNRPTVNGILISARHRASSAVISSVAHSGIGVSSDVHSGCNSFERAGGNECECVWCQGDRVSRANREFTMPPMAGPATEPVDDPLYWLLDSVGV